MNEIKKEAEKKNKILVIDDEPSICESLEWVLRRWYQVFTCSSGFAALGIIDQGFDVIILDIRMHGMNGFETLNEIRRKGVNTPVIFFSGFPWECHERVEASLHEPFAYIEKGAEIDLLLTLVAKAIDSQLNL